METQLKHFISSGNLKAFLGNSQTNFIQNSQTKLIQTANVDSNSRALIEFIKPIARSGLNLAKVGYHYASPGVFKLGSKIIDDGYQILNHFPSNLKYFVPNNAAFDEYSDNHMVNPFFSRWHLIRLTAQTLAGKNPDSIFGINLDSNVIICIICSPGSILPISFISFISFLYKYFKTTDQSYEFCRYFNKKNLTFLMFRVSLPVLTAYMTLEPERESLSFFPYGEVGVLGALLNALLYCFDPLLSFFSYGFDQDYVYTNIPDDATDEFVQKTDERLIRLNVTYEKKSAEIKQLNGDTEASKKLLLELIKEYYPTHKTQIVYALLKEKIDTEELDTREILDYVIATGLPPGMQTAADPPEKGISNFARASIRQKREEELQGAVLKLYFEKLASQPIQLATAFFDTFVAYAIKYEDVSLIQPSNYDQFTNKLLAAKKAQLLEITNVAKNKQEEAAAAQTRTDAEKQAQDKTPAVVTTEVVTEDEAIFIQAVNFLWKLISFTAGEVGKAAEKFAEPLQKGYQSLRAPTPPYEDTIEDFALEIVQESGWVFTNKHAFTTQHDRNVLHGGSRAKDKDDFRGGHFPNKTLIEMMKHLLIFTDAEKSMQEVVRLTPADRAIRIRIHTHIVDNMWRSIALYFRGLTNIAQIARSETWYGFFANLAHGLVDQTIAQAEFSRTFLPVIYDHRNLSLISKKIDIHRRDLPYFNKKLMSSSDGFQFTRGNEIEKNVIDIYNEANLIGRIFKLRKEGKPTHDLQTLALTGSSAIVTFIIIDRLGRIIRNSKISKGYTNSHCYYVAMAIVALQYLAMPHTSFTIGDIVTHGNPVTTKITDIVTNDGNFYIQMFQSIAPQVCFYDMAQNIYKKRYGHELPPRFKLTHADNELEAMLSVLHLIWFNNPLLRKYFITDETDQNNNLVLDLMSMSPLQCDGSMFELPPYQVAMIVTIGMLAVQFLKPSARLGINFNTTIVQCVMMMVSIFCADKYRRKSGNSQPELKKCEPTFKLFDKTKKKFNIADLFNGAAKVDVYCETFKPQSNLETEPTRERVKSMFPGPNLPQLAILTTQGKNKIKNISKRLEVLRGISGDEYKEAAYNLRAFIVKNEAKYMAVVNYASEDRHWCKCEDGNLIKISLSSIDYLSGDVQLLVYEKDDILLPTLETFENIVDEFLIQFRNNAEWSFISNMNHNRYARHSNDHFRCEFQAIALSYLYSKRGKSLADITGFGIVSHKFLMLDGRDPRSLLQTIDISEEWVKGVEDELRENMYQQNIVSHLDITEIATKEAFIKKLLAASMKADLENFSLRNDGDLTTKIATLNKKANCAAHFLKTNIEVYVNTDNTDTSKFATYKFPSEIPGIYPNNIKIACLFVSNGQNPSPIFHFFPLAQNV
jgi:hypothetical protein